MAQLPDFKPLANDSLDKAEPAEPMTPKKDGSWFKLPSLKMPKIDLMPKWKPKSPAPAIKTTWRKMNQGTKSFFAKTKQTLMPWSKQSADSRSTRPVTGTRRIIPPRREATQEKPSASFFSLLPGFGDEAPEEPQRKETVQDFLARPREQF